MTRRLAPSCLAIALAFAFAATGCFDPSDRRPGFVLRGERVDELPADWSFTDTHREIAIQVQTPYLLPHSVTIWCASVDGNLYVGARNPEEKHWPGWVDDEPDVRLRIGERIYEVRLEPVEDASRIAAIRRAYGAKYRLPDTTPDAPPPIRYWRVTKREA